MLIRSQNKELLIDTKNLVINEDATIMGVVSADLYFKLGAYNSYDEAVAVLNDIEKHFQKCYEADVYNVYTMPKKAYYLLHISKLKLDKALTKKLRKLGIKTIGDILEYEMLENYDDALTDDEVEAIQDAIQKFEEMK